MKATKYKIQDSGFRIRKTDNISILGSEKGIVLILSLMLLLVATVVGITALSTSTTNVMISGNQRLNEINFSGADSGVSVSVPVIKDTAFYMAVSSIYTTDPALVPDAADFVDEIGGTLVMDNDDALTNWDLTFPIGGITVKVDIDYLYAAAASGSSILMFMGYEGTGTGMGSGGALIYYSVDSYAEGPAGSQSRVYGVYQYITH